MPLSTLLAQLQPISDVYEGLPSQPGAHASLTPRLSHPPPHLANSILTPPLSLAETHALFTLNNLSASTSARNLGFISRTATSLTLSLGAAGRGREVTIQQSPALLQAHLAGGTTGAVLWRVSPLLANWLLLHHENENHEKKNLLWAHGVLGPQARVLELGAGATALLALAVGPAVGRYWISDQEYVLKLAQRNLDANLPAVVVARSTAARAKARARARARGKAKDKSRRRGEEGEEGDREGQGGMGHIETIVVDWEHTALLRHPVFQAGGGRSLSLVLAADCIYNEALVTPFVDTCVDACRLNRDGDEGRKDEDGGGGAEKTLVLVAQELRSSDVFEAWLEAFADRFHVWRVPEAVLGPELAPKEGFAVHVGVLKD